MSRLTLLALFIFCQLASLFAALWMFCCILVGSKRAWRLAVSYDQLLNTATGGNEDETVSSRANRARRAGRRWGCILCRILDWLDPDHCSKSEEKYLSRPERLF